MREAYLMAAGATLELLRRSEVGARWEQPSALAEWTVGGLAGHLAGQVSTAEQVLAHPVGDQEPIPLHEHYRRAAWVDSGVDDDVNVAIRQGGDAAAAEGQQALVASTEATLTVVRRTLADQPPDRVVVIPWQGWALTLNDFLVTRMMEITVHSDDLAASVDIDAPQLPREVLEPVLTLLNGLAVRRHGQAAVVRALTRSERAPATISAF